MNYNLAEKVKNPYIERLPELTNEELKQKANGRAVCREEGISAFKENGEIYQSKNVRIITR